MKEREKMYKYLDLNWDLKKLWIMEVTVITIVLSTLITVPQRLEKNGGIEY